MNGAGGGLGEKGWVKATQVSPASFCCVAVDEKMDVELCFAVLTRPLKVATTHTPPSGSAPDATRKARERFQSMPWHVLTACADSFRAAEQSV